MTDPQSFGDRLRSITAADGGVDAVRFVAPGRGVTVTLTRADLDRRSDAVAAALTARGVGVGDRVTFALANTPAFVDCVLGVWKVGATPIPIRWDIPAWELERIRTTADAATHLEAADLAAMIGTATDPLDAPVSPVAWGICSSGSTGTPKIILSTRAGAWDDAFGGEIVDGWRVVPRPQTVLVPAPMYHANAFTTLMSLLAGDRLVIMERFDEQAILDGIEQLGVTTFRATPTMLQRLADHPGIDRRDLSGLEYVVQGAAPMPDSLARRWIGLLGGDRLLLAYGMTEGLGLTALLGSEWLERPGSVGRGLRDTEIRILDDDGNTLPDGEIGEVWLRAPAGPGHRYLGAPEIPTTDDGFRTVGDVGRLDADGFLYLVDRRVDVIISGGANVYPAEVEAALIDHPGIADVVVVGLCDDRWGRRVHAIVESSRHHDAPDEAAVIAWARDRLSPYKVPKSVEFVDSMPRTAATKINRRALVEERGG